MPDAAVTSASVKPSRRWPNASRANADAAIPAVQARRKSRRDPGVSGAAGAAGAAGVACAGLLLRGTGFGAGFTCGCCGAGGVSWIGACALAEPAKPIVKAQE